MKEEVSKLRLEGSAAITQMKRRNTIVLSIGEDLYELRGEGGGGVMAEVLSVVTQWWRLGRKSRQFLSWRSEQLHIIQLYLTGKRFMWIQLRIIFPISQIHFDPFSYSYTLRDFPTVSLSLLIRCLEVE